VPSNPGTAALRRAHLDRAHHDQLGIVSAAFALIGGPISFLVLRFLLALPKPASFPGVILYSPTGTRTLSRDHRRHLHGGDPVAGLIARDSAPSST